MNQMITLSYLNKLIQGEYNHESVRLQDVFEYQEFFQEYFDKTLENIASIFDEVKSRAAETYDQFVYIARVMAQGWIEPESELGKAIGLDHGLDS